MNHPDSFVLGVIGHVDHGKTALVRALTGMETDRLPEEKRRGISIALGFAHLRVARTVVDLIDMPGHERFVRTMIGGATGIDAALLVVAANEGVMPQTVEHVEIAGMLGLKRALVVVTKADLADETEAELAGAEAAELAARCGLTSIGPILTSVTDGRGIEAAKQAIGALAQQGRAGVSDDGFFYLPIDRAFSVAGHGTVVTGTLRRGRITTGEHVLLLPGGRETRVRRLQVRGATVEAADPGRRVAVNLRDLAAGEVTHGGALVSPGLLEPSAWLTVRLRAAPSAPPLRNGQRLRLLYGTAETDVVLRLLDRDALEPGDPCFAQFRCAQRIVVPVREHVVLRTMAPLRSVAGGVVIEAAPRRQRRHIAAVLERLERMANSSPKEIVTCMLDTGSVRVLDAARLAGVSVGMAEATLREAGATLSGGFAARTDALERLAGRIMKLVSEQPDGLPTTALRAALGRLAQPLADLVMTHLGTRGAVLRDGRLRLRRVEQKSLESAAREIAEQFRRAGLMPPLPSQVAIDRRACEALVRAGMLVRTHDRAQKRDILFHRDAIDLARTRLMLVLAEGGLTVSEIGTALGISRKYSVPLLEYLDAVHFTRREGDVRRLRGIEPDRQIAAPGPSVRMTRL